MNPNSPLSFPPHLRREPAIWIRPAQQQAFQEAGTTAHRLASGPGGWVERLGDDVLISHKTEAELQEMLRDLASYAEQSGWQPTRIFTRYLPTKNDDRVAPQLHSGDPTQPVTTVVSEAGIRYGLDFSAGYSHGLFLDQRSNRASVGILKPKRILNTFAYTCSFSVAGALLGAETLSIDLSKKSLDRGRENFALNDVPVGKKHRFVVDDVMDALPQLAKKGEKFDLIVLDPPTFSRGNEGRRWQVEQHFEDLLNAALQLAPAKCAILLSTNCTKIDHIWLESTARYCSKLQRRSVMLNKANPQEDFPAKHGATTLWMHVR